MVLVGQLRAKPQTRVAHGDSPGRVEHPPHRLGEHVRVIRVLQHVAMHAVGHDLRGAVEPGAEEQGPTVRRPRKAAPRLDGPTGLRQASDAGAVGPDHVERLLVELDAATHRNPLTIGRPVQAVILGSTLREIFLLGAIGAHPVDIVVLISIR